MDLIKILEDVGYLHKPYLEIFFTGLIGYLFFAKQFFEQKSAERISQIQLQKDQLYKEIFDQIAFKLE